MIMLNQRTNYTSNKNLRKHKYYNAVDNKKQIERINLYKDQLIAVNDNLVFIIEIKLFDGLDKSTIDEFMYYLLCI